jgi:polyhydroxybutyrate depolymerase
MRFVPKIPSLPAPKPWTLPTCLVLLVAILPSVFAMADEPRSQPWRSGTHQARFAGLDRGFLLDVPKSLRPGAPLVLVFHGFTGSAASIRETAGFTRLVEKHGFVAVYPMGTTDSKGRTFFNVGYDFHRDQKVDDVLFARELSARLVRDLELDERSVFATGFSNGGDMSYFLGAQPQPFVTAIAPVAGTMMASWAGGFRPARRLSVLAINAVDDRTTLWKGDLENRDGWGAYLGTEAVIDLWVEGLSLRRKKNVLLPGGLRRTRWTTATDAAEVVFYRRETGGHEWPAHLGDPRRTTAEVVWGFFETHRPKSR